MGDCYIGIDLGGTRVKIGIVQNDKIISKVVMPAQSAKGLAVSLPVITKHINQLLDANSIQSDCLRGLSLGFPGIVDPFKKKVLSTNAKYDDALSVNMETWAREQWNVPFFIDNDARMATVGEWKYGAGKDTDNLVVMTIGTGIGTSVILEGKLVRGKHFLAGCLGGHITVQYNGRQCSCGNIGCVEAHAATWSIKERIREDKNYMYSLLSSKPAHDFESLFTAAEEGDALALSVRQECMNMWSAAIVNLIHSYDPEVVVVGGGAMNRKEVVLPYITEQVHKHAWTPWGQVSIRATELLSDAGILGAVYCQQNGI